MSFSIAFPQSQTNEIPGEEQFPLIISSIQQKLGVIKSAMNGVKSQSKDSRIQIHNNLKACNELGKKMQTGLNKLNNPSSKMVFTKWNKKLGQLLEEVTRFARIMVKSEEYVKENDDFGEEDALLSTQQQSLDFEIELQTDIIREREEKINRITHTIFTVNTMLKDLSEMVCEQGYMIDSMESNVEESVVKSKKAMNELSKTEKDSKSGKQRQCLIVLLVVLLLFVLTVLGTGYYRYQPVPVEEKAN
jgi:hypothetical protein